MTALSLIVGAGLIAMLAASAIQRMAWTDWSDTS